MGISITELDKYFTQKLVFTKAMFFKDGTTKNIVKDYPMKDCDKNSFTNSEFQQEYSDFLFNRGVKRIR